MLSILANRSYRNLFLAQCVALMGTGLTTVALGLMAFELAGEKASVVLGTVFTIKMIAYVGVSPIAAALTDRLPPRLVLVLLDLVRVASALVLPFVGEIWQIYVIIFVLQSASAAFTPTFQATIPRVLPDEAEYTRALSLSRLAYDVENIASPTLAALLLFVLSPNMLFFCTALGFLGSALLIVSVALPKPAPAAKRGFFDRTTRGIRIYLSTPRLHGLLALNLALAFAVSMVLVNSVVLVRAELGRGERDLAIAMGAFGLGSMMAALMLPRILDRVSDRLVMMTGACALVSALAGLGMVTRFDGLSWGLLLATWMVMGLGSSAVMTPSGRLLRRSVHDEDLPAIFAAQFALSHACWLVAYPLSGTIMPWLGAADTMIALAGLAAVSAVMSWRLWPRPDDQNLVHAHHDLPKDHPHLSGGHVHSHDFRIDDLHPRWPSSRVEEG